MPQSQHLHLPREDLLRCFGDSLTQVIRQRDRAQFPVFAEFAQYRGHVPLTRLSSRAIRIATVNPELVVDRTILHRFDRQMNIDGIPEAQRSRELTFRPHPRPTHQRTRLRPNQIQSHRIKEIAFRGLHIAKKIREMNQPGHIRFRKFNPPSRSMFACHTNNTWHTFILWQLRDASWSRRVRSERDEGRAAVPSRRHVCVLPPRLRPGPWEGGLSPAAATPSSCRHAVVLPPRLCPGPWEGGLSPAAATPSSCRHAVVLPPRLRPGPWEGGCPQPPPRHVLRR
jgi:hypothetical protein